MVGKILEYGTMLAADLGISAMGVTAMNMLTPANAKTAEQVCIFIGGTAITGVACNAANAYIKDYADNLRTLGKNIKEINSMKKQKKEEEVKPQEA